MSARSGDGEFEAEEAAVPGFPSSLASLGLRVARTTESVVGRRHQVEAIERELGAARRGLACIVLEGEPGIGKTRLLLLVEELARIEGFLPVGVTADEEIRGPLLLARSLLGAPALQELTLGAEARRSLALAVDALLGQERTELANLAPDRRVLHIFDLAAAAIRAAAAERPLALLIDDFQWADEDSLRLLRYMARTSAESALFLAFAARGEELAQSESATGLLADLERMGVLRRLPLSRLTQQESAELLQKLLGGPVGLQSSAVMHAQAEGVPFVLHEQARAYREAGLIQAIDGMWTLSRNADRMLPSGVRTLIRRREARLPGASKRYLAEGAILGRDFSLRDLREVRRRLGEDTTEARLALALEPAVAAGLLVAHADGAAADYGFTHGQVREFAAASLTPPDRRAVHAAILDMLTSEGTPSAASLALVAGHAMAAGESEMGARVTVDAAAHALEHFAPEEALRLVDQAHAVAVDPRIRAKLLRVQDDALEMLHRAELRLEGLAELAALAEALGDFDLELEVLLRRAAALRGSGDPAAAAGVARRVRAVALERGDLARELAACLELGQDLLGADLGEAYSRSSSEADLDGAEEAFERAAEVARELGDDPGLAAALRELGIIALSRIRHWFIERIGTPEHLDLLRRTATGEDLQDIIESLPIRPLVDRTNEKLRQALEIFDRIENRPGAMNTIIAMAFANWAPEIHLAGSPHRIEEIHRLMSRRESSTSERRRSLAQVQLLFGTHVYARAKVFPDVALVKGKEAYEAARSHGERTVEFSVAGSLALIHAELGQLEEATGWLDRAAELGRESPTPRRAREIEHWRGILCAADGHAEGLERHLQRAARLAADQGRSSHRCEILARLATEAVRIGAEQGDRSLLELGAGTASEVLEIMSVLPGHPPWGAQARSAQAGAALARGDPGEAAAFGRAALHEFDATLREDLYLEIVLPASAALLAGGTPQEVEQTRDRLNLLLGLVTQRIADPAVRALWFRAPLGRELVRLADPVVASDRARKARSDAPRLSEDETALLHALTLGRTNAEIAAQLGVSEDEVERRLAVLYLTVGATSRADATANAFIRRMV